MPHTTRLKTGNPTVKKEVLTINNPSSKGTAFGLTVIVTPRKGVEDGCDRGDEVAKDDGCDSVSKLRLTTRRLGSRTDECLVPIEAERNEGAPGHICRDIAIDQEP